MSLFKKVTFTVKGLTPLILHCGQTADPLNEFSKRLKKVSSKRKKVDEDHLEMSSIEWDSSLYRHESFGGTGLYMPSENIFACLVKASKKLKMGPFISAVLMDQPIGYALKTKYKTIEDAKRDPATWFKKIVSVQTSKVVRTRSIFQEWSIDVSLELDHSTMDVEQLKQILTIAGKSVGMGDWRPGSPKCPGVYGRFCIENFKATNVE